MVSYMIPEVSKSRTGQESIEAMSGCRGPWRDNGAPGVSSNGQKQSQRQKLVAVYCWEHVGYGGPGCSEAGLSWLGKARQGQQGSQGEQGALLSLGWHVSLSMSEHHQVPMTAGSLLPRAHPHWPFPLPSRASLST